MKLSLTVETDAVNILALNMERISVDIDGIELANLIDVVCDNGCILRFTEAPGEPGAEDPHLPVTPFNGIRCSTAHITEADNNLLFTLSHQYEDHGDSEWIMYTGSGYLLHLDAWLFPVLRLKRPGLPKTCRHLSVTLIRRYSANIIHLDASGELLPGTEVFDW